MKTEDDTVVFKSETYYFNQERDGVKPNTVRLLTYPERHQIKLLWKPLTKEYIKKIRIECVRASVNDACFDPFTRTLTSIEQIGELCGHYLFVFSWQHREGGIIEK